MEFQYLRNPKPTKWPLCPGKTQDQPGYPPSLINLCCLHKETLGTHLSIERTANTLNRLGRCPAGWSESSLGAQIILLGLSWGSSFNIPLYYKIKNWILYQDRWYFENGVLIFIIQQTWISLSFHPLHWLIITHASTAKMIQLIFGTR